MTQTVVAEAELRRDPISGRLVVVAPGRSKRPGAFRRSPIEVTREELDSCPFCAGREERTPPETLRLPSGAEQWQVRVVPNLYPAFAGQEVVIHTPRHCHFLAELTVAELAGVAEAWQSRAAARQGYLHAFVNERSEAGASLPHSHSQLVWFDAAPPEVERELRPGWCPVCDPPGGDQLVIAERNGVTLRAAWAGRMPYELLLAPVEHESDPWRSERLAGALQLAADALRRLHALEGPCPMNLWLHDAGHWHIEIVPRLTVLAGIELGAGYFVNPLPPETAAAALRSADASQAGS
jgi:UDPglucose--hexose-1-phosphate uridylyltransferase